MIGNTASNFKVIDQTADEMWNQMSDEVKYAYGQEYYDERKQIMKSYITSGEMKLTSMYQSSPICIP